MAFGEETVVPASPPRCNRRKRGAVKILRKAIERRKKGSLPKLVAAVKHGRRSRLRPIDGSADLSAAYQALHETLVLPESADTKIIPGDDGIQSEPTKQKCHKRAKGSNPFSKTMFPNKKEELGTPLKKEDSVKQTGKIVLMGNRRYRLPTLATPVEPTKQSDCKVKNGWWKKKAVVHPTSESTTPDRSDHALPPTITKGEETKRRANSSKTPWWNTKESADLDAYVKILFTEFGNFAEDSRALLCLEASLTIRYYMAEQIDQLIRLKSDRGAQDALTEKLGKPRPRKETAEGLTRSLLRHSETFKQTNRTVVNDKREIVERVSTVVGIATLTCSTIPSLILAGPGGALLAVAAKEAMEAGAKTVIFAGLSKMTSIGQAEAWFWNLGFENCQRI